MRGVVSLLSEDQNMLDRLKALFGKAPLAKLPVLLDSAEIEKLMPSIGAFPRPEWDAIAEKIETEYADQLEQAWQDFAHIWLTRLSYRLERGYRVQRSREFILLSSLNERRAGFVLQTLEGMRKRIIDTLGWSRDREGFGLYPVLLFADAKTYFEYVEAFGPEGEEPTSFGKFLDGPYGHIALIEQELWRIEQSMAYLLTHNILRDSRMPWWLQFGLCNHFSDLYDQGEILPQVNSLGSWLEEASGFWTEKRVTELWDGTLLGSEDRDKAEKFALLLTRAVIEKVRNVQDFLERASWEDAGRAAVLQDTGRPLSQFVQGILGPGDWEPKA